MGTCAPVGVGTSTRLRESRFCRMASIGDLYAAVTSAILELLIYPVIFVVWRQRTLPKDARNEVSVAVS